MAQNITAGEQLTVLLAVYKENADQARHHEVQRERVTTLVGQATGVVLALLGTKAAFGVGDHTVPLVAAVFLIVLGLWGFLASSRHYERSRLHVHRLRELRQSIETLSNVPLRGIHLAADAAHEKVFDPYAFRYRRTHLVWNAFHLIVAVLGVVLLFQAEPVLQCCS